MEPVGDDELLFRRIPAHTDWYNPLTRTISPAAFRPSDNDTTGLSFSRAQLNPLGPSQEAARGRAGKQYYVAVLKVADLRAAGIEVVPVPQLPSDPGHAEAPSVTSANRKLTPSRENIQLLRSLVVEVVGPFDGQKEPPLG